MNDDDLYEAALSYAARGWAVLPCADTKQPMTRHGFHDASDDPQVIGEWWATMFVPALGLSIPDGLVVLDVDPRNGGDATLRGLIDRDAWAFRSTLRCRTRGGGAHFYFRFALPEGKTWAKTAGAGIDVRAPGKGYVIVPPTVGYSWVGTHDPQPLPFGFRALVTRREADDSIDGVVDVAPRYFPFEDGTAYGLAALRNAVERMRNAQEGERNYSLFREAANLGNLAAGGELDPDVALEALADAAREAGLDPFEHGTLRSGWDKGLRQPRRAPQR